MFIASILIMIVVGLYQYSNGSLEQFVYTQNYFDQMHTSIGVLTITLILRAFSSGSAALTGIESYANGVSAYKSPVMSKAIFGIIMMTLLSIVMFAGVTFIATKTKYIQAFQKVYYLK